jgi:hypothetical protein
MSKKKNTLKELDEFLKQQAASLVTPSRLGGDKTEKPEVDEPEPEHVEVSKVPERIATPEAKLSTEKILADLRQLAEKEGGNFRKKLYDMIIQLLESQQHQAAEDKMMINTALYLKHGEHWKEAIREYWRNKVD